MRISPATSGAEESPRPCSLAERILLKACRDVRSADYPGGTSKTRIDNALDFMEIAVPGFRDLVRGKTVLDFGCGHGWQAAALARDYDAEVYGVDLARPVLQATWERIAAEYHLPNLTLTTASPDRLFDVVYSCSSFEHFGEPDRILSMMRDKTRPGGKVVVAFAEPWYSPHGSHMNGFTRLPWVNLLFSESVVLRVRSRYRSDGATRYEDVEGGLNRMTVARFEHLMRTSGMRIESLTLLPVKRLPLVSKVPVLRELLTAAASCVLTRI